MAKKKVEQNLSEQRATAMWGKAGDGTKCLPSHSAPSAFWGSHEERTCKTFFPVLSFQGFAGSRAVSLNYESVASEGGWGSISSYCAPLSKAQQNYILKRTQTWLLHIANLARIFSVKIICVTSACGVLVSQFVTLVLEHKYPSQKTTGWKRRHISLIFTVKRKCAPYHVRFN